MWEHWNAGPRARGYTDITSVVALRSFGFFVVLLSLDAGWEVDCTYDIALLSPPQVLLKTSLPLNTSLTLSAALLTAFQAYPAA